MTNQTTYCIAAVATLFSPALAIADDGDSDPEIVAIQKKYQDKITAMTDKVPQPPTPVEKAIGVQVITNKVRHTITVNLPHFKAKMVTVSFKVPEITGTPLKFIHYKVPETHKELRVIGRVPKINHFHVTWQDVKTYVVVVQMVDHEVKYNWPDLHMKQIDVKTLLPELAGTTSLKVVYDLPDVTVHQAGNAQTEADKELADAQKAIDDLISAEKSEITGVALGRLTKQRTDLDKQHDTAIKSIDEAITGVHNAGLDSKSVSLDDGSKQNLDQQKTEIDNSFHDALKQIDDAIAKLGQLS